MKQFRLFFLGIVFLFGLVVFSVGAQAAVFTVTNTNDSGPGSVSGARNIISGNTSGSEVTTAGAFCDSVTEVPQAECEALVALYDSAGGATWTNNSGWLTTNTPCSWYGVTCGAAHVTALALYSNQLSGSIPPELGSLANLTSLSLHSNQLSGSIPPELGNLASLTSFHLAWNQLSGSIPPELGGLANLTSLALLDNQLSGSIPPELGSLANLTSLSLADNQLSGGIPPQLGNLANLKGLSLHINQLSGSIPPELGDLAKLTSLSLHSNQLSGSIPPELGNLVKLEWLALGDNQLSGSIPPQLGNLVKLTYFNLGYNQLSGSIPPELGSLANLQGLLLYGNQLSGSIPPELGSLANLTGLHLGDNQLSGSIPLELGNLANNLTSLQLYVNQLSGTIPITLGNLVKLTELRLYSNQLSGSIPPELGNLTNLTDLDLSGNQLSSIPAELGNLTNLTYLNLYSNQLSGSIPPELGNLDNLTYLQLSGNQLSGSIPPELGNLDNLTGLHLESNQLSGSIPSELGNLANLQELSLYVNQLSGSIPITLGNLANLTGLYLASNQLSGSIPPELGNLTNLQGLWLSDNQLSGSIPLELGNLANLQWLWLSGTQLSGSIPLGLGNLANLTYLHLGDNQLSGSIPPELGNLVNVGTLRLEYNALEGDIPAAIVNLVNLNANPGDSTDISYNKLTASDPAVRVFLNDKDPDWAETQTVSPTDVQADAQSGSTVELTWTPIPYTGHGGYYEISYATTPGGPHTVHGTTSDKTAASYTAGSLSPGTVYYFVLRTYTPAHWFQQNALWSAYSQEVSVLPPSPLLPGKLAIYYGFPSAVNGAADLDAAAAVFADYDVVIFAGVLQFPQASTAPDDPPAPGEDPVFGCTQNRHFDRANTATIIDQLTTLHNTAVYGYVSIGGENTFSACGPLDFLGTVINPDDPLQIKDGIKERIDRWAAMGVTGIFLDEAGYDFGASRERQNQVVDYVHCVDPNDPNRCNSSGVPLSVFINAWNPDDIFSPDEVGNVTYSVGSSLGGQQSSIQMNPDGLPTHLGPNDISLLESFQITKGDPNSFRDPGQWEDKSDKALRYKAQFGTRMATVTTIDDTVLTATADGNVNLPVFKMGKSSDTKYVLTVNNNTPNTVNNVVVTDTLQVGGTFVSSTPPQCSESDGIVTCVLSSLASDDKAEFTIVLNQPVCGLIFDQLKFDYAWWSTFGYGFDFMSWGEGPHFSASGSCSAKLPFHERPNERPATDPTSIDGGSVGSAFTSPVVVHDLSLHTRTTTEGTIEVNTNTHTGRFLPPFGRVAFHSYDYYGDPAGEIHIWDLATDSAYQRGEDSINSRVQYPMNPQFSVNGRYLTLMGVDIVLNKSWPELDVFVYDLATDTITNLSDELVNSSLLPEDRIDEDPSFHPDGTKIVFKRRNGPCGPGFLCDLWELTFDPGTLAPLTVRQLTDSPTVEESGPRYLPDQGNTIFFWEGVNADAAIKKIPAAGGPHSTSTLVVDNPGLQDMFPVFQDVDHLLYSRWTSSTEQNDQIYVHNLVTGTSDGANDTPASFNIPQANDSDPFAVKGNWVGFSSDRPGGKGGWDLFIGDLNDSRKLYPLDAASTPKHDLGASYTPHIVNAEGVPAPSGLVSWWPGDGSGQDLVSSNHGVLQTGKSWFAPGKVGQAFSFDGFNDFISFGTVPSITGTGDFTVDAWVKTTDPQGVIIQQRDASTSGFNGEYVLSVGGVLTPGGSGKVCWATYGDEQFGFNFCSNTSVDDGQFHHIAAVREADGTGKIYIDGVLRGSEKLTSSKELNFLEVFLGADKRDDVAFFNGLIDEVDIFDRALTQTEIQAIFDAGAAGKFKPTPLTQALYVWRNPDPQLNGTPIDLDEAQRLADFAVAEGIQTVLYDNFGCGAPSPDCPTGAEQQDSATLAPIISLLHEHGLRVEALYTDITRISDVVNYNSAVQPDERFDGIRLNIEFPEFPSGAREPITPADLELYATAVTQAVGLPVYASIGHHWGSDPFEPVIDVNGNGLYDADVPGESFTDVNGNGEYDPDRLITYNSQTKEAYKHILDIVAGVDVQTAQDTPGVIVDITKDEVCYGNSLNKPVHITIETYDVVTHLGLNDFNTFFEEGEVGMKDALATIDYTALGVNAPCSDPLPTGFAYHFYRQSYGSPSLPRWAPDEDGDYIVDSVDPQPNSFSGDFGDVGLGGATTGTITDRGDQTFAIADATNPDDGVLTTAAYYGGATPATVSACNAVLSISAGDEVIVTCGSVTIEVNSGTVEITFAASDGTLATTSLGEGNALTFEPTTITFAAPPTNSDPVVVLVEGEELSLTPGQDVDFNRPPEVGEVTAPVEPVQVNTEISASADFTDPDVPENHTAVWDWGDGSQPTVIEILEGSRSVNASHTYTTPGVYTVRLTVTDNLDAFGESVFQYVVVYDPEGGFVTGGGWINSPAGAYTPDPSLTGKANFGFVSKYKKGATVPTGQMEFQFPVANLNFHSTSYQWLAIAGPKAKFKGSCTINGSGDYGFMLTATDGQVNGGGGVDEFWIKIWDRATEEVVYDNQMGDADDADATDAIEGGSIVIHNNKK